MGEAVVGIVLCLVALTLIVLVHEAAHALAARAVGARVTELAIGMPFGPRVYRQSRRSGIRYGVTLALLGGYTRITGMAWRPDKDHALALALVNARGRLSADELATVLSCPFERAASLLGDLEQLASIEPVGEDGAPVASGEEVACWRTPRRDALGLTIYDRGHDFSLPGGTAAGASFFPKQGADEFLRLELSRTYAGKGLLARALILLAGIAANLLTAILLIMAFYMFRGVDVVAPDLKEVVAGSQAEQAGMVVGDVITSVGGTDVSQSYAALTQALTDARGAGDVDVAFRHAGEDVEQHATISLGDDEQLGVYYGYDQIRLGVGDALRGALAYAGQTGQALLSLFVPSTSAETLGEVSGIVGVVSVMGQAAQQGGWVVLTLIAALSLSLAWMNLLPLPPLDGGKLVIEVIQKVIGRPISLQVQTVISMVTLLAFTLLFFVLLFQDTARLVGGGF